MDTRSVFYEEWLRSLREQYKLVARSGDRVTLSSLTAVMKNAGFRDAELAQLRVEATMHIDAVDEDFQPDMTVLDAVKAAGAHPAECLCPQCVSVDIGGHDEEGQPVAVDPEAAETEAAPVFPAADFSEAGEAADAEPETFADSVAAESAPAEETEAEAPGDDEIEAEPDPDAPQQINLF